MVNLDDHRMPCRARCELAAPPSPPHTTRRQERPAPTRIEPAVLATLPLTEVLHVHVGSQPHVVGEIPARMIRIFIDHDLISAPVPPIAIAQIIRSHAKVESAKPETARTAAPIRHNMPRPKPSTKMPMLPGVVKMIVRVVTPRSMSNPMAIIMHMGSVRMSRSILKIPAWLPVRRGLLLRRRMIRLRTTCRGGNARPLGNALPPDGC